MMIQVDFWQLVGLLVAFFGFVFAAGRLLLSQIDRRLEQRFAAVESAASDIQQLERDFLKWQAKLPKRGSGAYFTRMLIEKCQEDGVPILRLRKPSEFVLDPNREAVIREWIETVLKPVIDAMPTDRRTVFGQDFGRSGDLSVVWPLQEVHSTLWRTPFLIELRNIPFDCQWQVVDWLFENLPLLHHAKFDGRGNGQSHAEKAVQKLGPEQVEGVMATAKWYAESFPRYRHAFEGGNILVPKSEDVIADHRQVVLVKGNPTMNEVRVKGSDGLPRHGDSAIAGLLAWEAAQTEDDSMKDWRRLGR